MRRADAARAPLVIGLLTVAALAVAASVAWKIWFDGPTGPAVDAITIMNTIDAERQAREKDIAALGSRLDQMKADSSKRDDKVDQQIKAEADTRGDAIKQLDARVKYLESRLPPPTPPPNSVTLNSAQVRLVQTRGKGQDVRVYPGIGTTARATIQSADITFYVLPLDKNECKLGKPTPDCPNFICNEKGSYATIPDDFVSSDRRYCLRMTFSLKNGDHGVALGGPIEPHDGSWQRDTTACDTVAGNQGAGHPVMGQQIAPDPSGKGQCQWP